MPTHAHRFSLDSSSRKFQCAGCHKKRMVRYKDNKRNEYLPKLSANVTAKIIVGITSHPSNFSKTILIISNRLATIGASPTNGKHPTKHQHHKYKPLILSLKNTYKAAWNVMSKITSSNTSKVFSTTTSPTAWYNTSTSAHQNAGRVQRFSGKSTTKARSATQRSCSTAAQAIEPTK